MRKIHDKQECQDVVIQQDQRTPKRRQLQSPTDDDGNDSCYEIEMGEKSDESENDELEEVSA